MDHVPNSDTVIFDTWLLWLWLLKKIHTKRESLPSNIVFFSRIKEHLMQALFSVVNWKYCDQPRVPQRVRNQPGTKTGPNLLILGKSLEPASGPHPWGRQAADLGPTVICSVWEGRSDVTKAHPQFFLQAASLCRWLEGSDWCSFHISLASTSCKSCQGWVHLVLWTVNEPSDASVDGSRFWLFSCFGWVRHSSLLFLLPMAGHHPSSLAQGSPGATVTPAFV